MCKTDTRAHCSLKPLTKLLYLNIEIAGLSVGSETSFNFVSSEEKSGGEVNFTVIWRLCCFQQQRQQ